MTEYDGLTAYTDFKNNVMILITLYMKIGQLIQALETNAA